MFKKSALFVSFVLVLCILIQSMVFAVGENPLLEWKNLTGNLPTHSQATDKNSESVWSSTVSGNYLYSWTANGIDVFDISGVNASAPVHKKRIISFPIPEDSTARHNIDCRGIEVAGDYLYAIYGGNTLRRNIIAKYDISGIGGIYNLDDVSVINLESVAEYYDFGTEGLTDFVIRGNVLYCYVNRNLYMIDISGNGLTLISKTELKNASANGASVIEYSDNCIVMIGGSYIFAVPMEADGTPVKNEGDSANQTTAYHYLSPSSTFGYNVELRHLNVVGDIAYIAASNGANPRTGLVVLDLTDPSQIANPTKSIFFQWVSGVDNDYQGYNGMVNDGHNLYTARNGMDRKIIDVYDIFTDPFNITLKESYTYTSGGTENFTGVLNGKNIYFGGRQNGIQTFEIKQDLRITSHRDDDTIPSGAAVISGSAIVPAGATLYVQIDSETPVTPAIVGKAWQLPVDLSAGAHTITASIVENESPNAVLCSDVITITAEGSIEPIEYTSLDFDMVTLEEGDLEVSTTITNNTEGTEQIALFIALYKGNQLVKVGLDVRSLLSGDTDDYSATISLSATEAGAGYSIKAFLWNGTTSLVPLDMLSFE